MQTTPPCLALSAVVMSQHNDRGSTAYSLQAPRPTGAAAEVLPQRQKHQIYWCAPRWESFTVTHRASEHSTAKFPFQGSFLPSLHVFYKSTIKGVMTDSLTRYLRKRNSKASEGKSPSNRKHQSDLSTLHSGQCSTNAAAPTPTALTGITLLLPLVELFSVHRTLGTSIRIYFTC